MPHYANQFTSTRRAGDMTATNAKRWIEQEIDKVNLGNPLAIADRIKSERRMVQFCKTAFPQHKNSRAAHQGLLDRLEAAIAAFKV